MGLAIPTVYFLDTVASPWRNNTFDSTPLGELTVILLLTINGPLNLETTLLSGPPSTLIDLANTPSTGSITFKPGSSAMSSPSTVWTGVSKISSLPVIVLSRLLPEYEIPLSFIPV